MVAQVVDLVRQAGIVGAGGAGFPTHVKLDAKVDTYIVNGAECEPLLYKDKELMRLYAGRLIRGLRLGMEVTGAKRGVIAVKRHYHDAIAAMEALLEPGMELYLFDNFYPAGDEYVVVYEVTGRLIPPAGIPLQVGCVVNNVETLINMAYAVDEGIPVTHKFITVTGAVANPGSFAVPVGISYEEAVDLAGGATEPDTTAVDGGAMMGSVIPGPSARVTKTTGGYIVLPRSHRLIQRKTQTEDVNVRIARSACDQCSYCTELCPRYLLGYGIEPHKVMRAVGFEGETQLAWERFGLLCCECSLCSLYACPEDLPPKEMCVRSKKAWAGQGERPKPLEGLGSKAHPMREFRKVPVPRLIQRLGLNAYDRPAPMVEPQWQPQQVRLLLSQHIGAPCVPAVSEGQQVAVGQVVAEPPEGKLGATIHASIAGTVSRIDDRSIWISR